MSRYRSPHHVRVLDAEQWERAQMLRRTMHPRIRAMFGLDAQFSFIRRQQEALAQGSLAAFTESRRVADRIRAAFDARNIR